MVDCLIGVFMHFSNDHDIIFRKKSLLANLVAILEGTSGVRFHFSHVNYKGKGFL